MSSATSRAAIEILIGTRAMRGTAARQASQSSCKDVRGAGELGSTVGADLDATQSVAVGNLLLSNLRGLVGDPTDHGPTRRYRQRQSDTRRRHR